MALEEITPDAISKGNSPYWLSFEIETNGNYFCIIVWKRYKDGREQEFFFNIDIPLVNVRCERSMYMGKDLRGISLVGMKNLIDFPAETVFENPEFPDEPEIYRNEFILNGTGMDLWNLSEYFFQVTGANFMMGRLQPTLNNGEVATKV